MSFVALREVASSFGVARSPRRERQLCALAVELGAVSIPLLFRELAGREPAWATRLLEAIADAYDDLHPRIVEGLRAMTTGAGKDEAKVAALTLLAALGEPASSASFADPIGVHRRSLAELSSLLTCPPDVALAAELLITQLDGDAICEFVDGLAQSAPARTRHLVDELLLRTDLDPALRSELVRIAAPIALVEPEPLTTPPHRRPRTFLLHHDARTVVVVLRHDDDTWRCLCALVDGAGVITDALYRDDTTPRTIEQELVEPLLADGFVHERGRSATARALLAAAARRTVAAGRELPSAYFLGRDLLDLADAHEPDGRRREADLPTTLLARGVDLLAAGDFERARPLLERCVALIPDDADAAASFGLCLLGTGELDGARAHLERAAHLEPRWPMHHWNLAAIAHRQGRLAACHTELRRYLAVAPRDNAEHAPRIELAERFVADHQRLRRLTREVPRTRRGRSAPRTAPA